MMDEIYDEWDQSRRRLKDEGNESWSSSKWKQGKITDGGDDNGSCSMWPEMKMGEISKMEVMKLEVEVAESDMRWKWLELQVLRVESKWRW